MRICLVVDPARAFRWHRWLAEDLAASGRHCVVCCRGEPSRTWSAGLQITLRLDRLVHRLSGEHAIDPLRTQDLDWPSCSELRGQAVFDVVIDCAGAASALPKGQRVLTPLFDGRPSEIGALAALLDERPVDLGIQDSEAPGAVVIARPAVASRICLTVALDNLLSRAIDLIVQRVDRPGRSRADSRIPSATTATVCSATGSRQISRSAHGHLAGQIAAKISKKLLRQESVVEHWAIGLRCCAGPGLVAGGWPAEATYRVLKDDGRRYFADPFLFDHGGRSYLFCEEFPFETERGVISVSEVGPGGRLSRPRPIIERPHHLSYPVVFADAGQIWMIPEAAASGGVELYRAVEFPLRWNLEGRLLDGVAACDATLLHTEGGFFMFLSTANRLSTTWDNLRVYTSPKLAGPWQAHSTGIAMIDARRSRSAGAIIECGEHLLRPSQDCSRTYGGGIVLSRIDRLNEQEYEQIEVAEIVALGPQGVTGPHTYSKVGTHEAIDVSGAVDGVEEVTLACRPTGASSGEDELVDTTEFNRLS